MTESGPSGQSKNMSSINLNNRLSFLNWESRKSCSRWPMNRLASQAAIRVPMAVPLTWRKFWVFKEKLLWVSWIRNLMDGWVWEGH